MRVVSGNLSKAEKLLALFERIWRCFKCFDGICEDCFESLGADLGSQGAKSFRRSLFLRGPWVFPPWKSSEIDLVEGFFGNGGDRKVTFIAPRPSTGKFPSWRTKIFYGLLNEFDLNDSHLTDFVKCRGPAGGKNQEMEETCYEEIFKEEIEIIEPDLVVAIGREAEKLCERYLGSRNLKKITHYASWGSKESIRKKIQDDMKEIFSR